MMDVFTKCNLQPVRELFRGRNPKRLFFPCFLKLSSLLLLCFTILWFPDLKPSGERTVRIQEKLVAPSH
jgi:hypothetical protein